MKRVLAATTILLILLASGCVHDSDPQPQPDQEPLPDQEIDEPEETSENEEEESEGPRTVRIRNEGKSFVPEEVEVEAGREIEFVFDKKDGTHSLRIPEMGAGTGTLTYENNESFSVTFEEEGEYDFICSIGTHAQEGMNGTIIVS